MQKKLPNFIILLCVVFSIQLFALTDVIVHDLVMIIQNNIYYVFCTGSGISVFSSTDMKNWNGIRTDGP